MAAGSKCIHANVMSVNLTKHTRVVQADLSVIALYKKIPKGREKK